MAESESKTWLMRAIAGVTDVRLLTATPTCRTYRALRSASPHQSAPCVYRELRGSLAYLRHHDALLGRLVRAQANAAGSLCSRTPSLPGVLFHELVTFPDGDHALAVVTSWLEGVTLADALMVGWGGGPISTVGSALRLMAGVAWALADTAGVLDDAELVHQDLKPSNIVLLDYDLGASSLGAGALSPNGPALSRTPGFMPACALIDLDLAYLVGDTGRCESREMPAYRPSPHGTPAYAAPECYGGVGSVDMASVEPGPASDVFSLAVIAHEVLAGCLPYSEPPVVNASFEAWGSYLRRSPSPIRIDAGLPAPVARVLATCLTTDAGARPRARRVAELFEELAPAYAHLPLHRCAHAHPCPPPTPVA